MQLLLPSLIPMIGIATLLRFPDTSCVVVKRSGCEGNCLLAVDAIQILHVPSATVCALLCRLNNCCVLEYTEVTRTCSMDADLHMKFSEKFQRPVAVDEWNMATGKSIVGTPWHDVEVITNILDGFTNTFYHSGVGAADSMPWVLIDLKKNFVVSSVRILPRTGNHGYRFRDTQVLLGDVKVSGDFSSYTLIGTIDGPLLSSHTDWITITVDQPRCSRYVAVHKYIEHPYATFVLEIFEMEVLTSLN